MAYQYFRGDFIRLNESETGVLLDVGGQLCVYFFAPEFLEEYGASAKGAFVGEPVELTLDKTSRIRRILPTLIPKTTVRALTARQPTKKRQVVELLEQSLGKQLFSEELAHVTTSTKLTQLSAFPECFSSSSQLSVRSFLAMANTVASDPVSSSVLAAVLYASSLSKARCSEEPLAFEAIELNATMFLKLQQKLSTATVDKTADKVTSQSAESLSVDAAPITSGSLQEPNADLKSKSVLEILDPTTTTPTNSQESSKEASTQDDAAPSKSSASQKTKTALSTKKPRRRLL